MKCKFCGNNKKLIKAHIIPECFFVIVNESDETSKLITEDPNIPPKRSQIGVYDQNLVCLECEKKFGKYDDYAINFFKNKSITKNEIRQNNKVHGFIIESFDYTLLKLFFISLLWRASESSQEFFKHIKADPFHEKLKQHISTQDPGTIHDFSVMIWKFDDNPDKICILSPLDKRFEGVRCYHFFFYGFHCLVKVSSINFPTILHKYLLSPNKQLFIGSRAHKGSTYYNLVAQMVKRQKYKVFKNV